MLEQETANEAGMQYKLQKIYTIKLKFTLRYNAIKLENSMEMKHLNLLEISWPATALNAVTCRYGIASIRYNQVEIWGVSREAWCAGCNVANP